MHNVKIEDKGKAKIMKEIKHKIKWLKKVGEDVPQKNSYEGNIRICVE